MNYFSDKKLEWVIITNPHSAAASLLIEHFFEEQENQPVVYRLSFRGVAQYIANDDELVDKIDEIINGEKVVLRLTVQYQHYSIMADAAPLKRAKSGILMRFFGHVNCALCDQFYQVRCWNTEKDRDYSFVKGGRSGQTRTVIKTPKENAKVMPLFSRFDESCEAGFDNKTREEYLNSLSAEVDGINSVNHSFDDSEES